MKLWVLAPVQGLEKPNNPWASWYDKAFGFVVRAKDETEARMFAAGNGGDEIDWPVNPWKDSTYSTCEELSGDGPSGVIMRDFWSA